MRLCSSVAIVFALLAYVVAAPSSRSGHVVHEKRAFEPLEWIKSRRLEADRVLPMRFGLSQQNLHKVEEMLMAVSHPQSPTYGQHWSPADIVDVFAPTDETIATVTAWLTDSGLTSDRIRLTANKGWIEVNATTAEIEELLNTEYHVYTHSTGAEQVGSYPTILLISRWQYYLELGCHSYSVPEHIRGHIDIILPTVQFDPRAPSSDNIKRKRFERQGMPGSGLRTGPKTNGVKVTVTPSLENCDVNITPDCLRALYSIDYTPVATEKNSYGIGMRFIWTSIAQ